MLLRLEGGPRRAGAGPPVLDAREPAVVERRGPAGTIARQQHAVVKDCEGDEKEDGTGNPTSMNEMATEAQPREQNSQPNHGESAVGQPVVLPGQFVPARLPRVTANPILPGRHRRTVLGLETTELQTSEAPAF